MNVIEFRDVVKSFDGRKVLDGLSFSVAEGEIFALVGPSGGGKSVILKHIAGLIGPDAGEVCVGRRRIGYLFQSGALLAWLTVGENVALPLVEAGELSEAEITSRVDSALEAVGLSADRDKYPGEISGGMQKRAGLARVIVREADVILYDEPTSALDPLTALQISRLIRDVNRNYSATSVVVTHDLGMAIKYADRILLLRDGKAALCARPDEFMSSRDPAVAGFLAAAKGGGL
jgi:phospholipid/cholesterol/gamma-HCH transport system ATP-binding protein